MKKFLIVFAFAIIWTLQLYAVEPVVSVKKVDFESIEGKSNVMNALLDSYKKAVMLEAQIISLEERPNVSIPDLPEYRDLDEKGSSKLRDLAVQYNSIALTLWKQVNEMAEPEVRISDLKTKIKSTQNELMKERKRVFEANNYCYEEKMKLINEMNNKCENYLKGMSDQYEQNYKNSIEILSAAVVGYKYFSANSSLEPDLSLGARVELNAYPLIHFGKNFEFWGEYVNPVISTTVFQNTFRWNVDYYSVGLNVVVPHLFQLFANTDVGIKLGGGHYWGTGKIYNYTGSYVVFKGEQLRFEANVVKYKWFFPVELFFAGNINFSKDPVIFNYGLDQLNYGSAFPNSISMGIRLCLWWHPNIQESQSE